MGESHEMRLFLILAKNIIDAKTENLDEYLQKKVIGNVLKT